MPRLLPVPPSIFSSPFTPRLPLFASPIARPSFHFFPRASPFLIPSISPFFLTPAATTFQANDNNGTSYARITLLPDNTLSGWLRIGADTYFLSPPLSTPTELPSSTAAPAACIAHRRELIPVPQALMPTPHDNADSSNNNSQTSVPSHTQAHAHSHVDLPRLPYARARRAGPASSQHVVCGVFLDADASFLAQWGGDCLLTDSQAQCAARREARAIVRMLDIAHQTIGIYEDPVNFGQGPVTLQVAGVNVMPNEDLGLARDSPSSPVDPNALLGAYQAFLGAGAMAPAGGGPLQAQAVRGAKLPTSQDVCLNHLFTHSNCNNVLGVASTASPAADVAGGVCEFHIFPNPTRAVNTGFSTTQSAGGASVPLWQTVKTMAHELGHNMGAQHDCCPQAGGCDRTRYGLCQDGPGSHSCYPTNANGGVFLMFPSISPDSTLGNEQRFSPCTLTAVRETVAAKGACLLRPDPCAFGGPCCNSDGSVRPRGTPCRNPDPLVPCQGAAVCTGADGQCPANPARPDGSYCDRDSDPETAGTHATCLAGVCSQIHEGFCRAEENQPGCSLPGAECVRTCGTGRCVPFASGCNIRDPNDGGLFFYRNQALCPMAPTGTPCIVGGADGQVRGGKGRRRRMRKIEERGEDR